MLGHDLSYLLDVLHIADGETEEQLDERLKSEAKELGVDVNQDEKQRAQLDDRQFRTHPPVHVRRSESFDSKASRSTGLVSNYSELSREQGGYDGGRRRSRASLSFRDYDRFLARGVPNGRQSLSFTSPLTTPSTSTFSLPLSQPASPGSSPKKHFRRIRGLSMLKLYRNDSASSLAEGCPHCPQDSASQRRAVHRLPCGHHLCTQALRNTVKKATDSKFGAVPSCCGRPIPGSTVEEVMTQEEQNALLEKLGQWDEAISVAPSTQNSRRGSVPSIQQGSGASSQRNGMILDEHRLDALPPYPRREIESIMEREDYKLVLTGQCEQRDRFLAWAQKQRKDLQIEHDQLREEMRRIHEAALEDLIEHHASAISNAEDKQVKAEADLRATQSQERLSNATALKHMQAYCSGTYSSGQPHNRIITDQDRSELDKTEHIRDNMPAKHGSQINVLRGEQGRRMRLRVQRQDREVQELQRSQRKEELELERKCTAGAARLEESVTSKQRKIRWRWELQNAILAKKIEAATGLKLDGWRLPTAEEKGEVADVERRGMGDVRKGISTGFAVRGQCEGWV